MRVSINSQAHIALNSQDAAIDKILFQHSTFGNQRFLAQIGIGSMSHAKIMQAIELPGSHVAPLMCEVIGEA